jgi:hypothetical protein
MAIGLAAALGMLLFTSCGRKEEPQKEAPPSPDPYATWSKYTYGHFVARFSPASPYVNRMGELTKAYERFLTEICGMLEMAVPEQRIHLYVYSNRLETQEIRGEDAPTVTDSAIHWDGSYAYGYQLTKFLLAKKGIQPGRFNVINEGIPHLLNYAGINYHAITTRLVDSGGYVPLLMLGDNAVFDTLRFKVKQSESASLCGFIMFNFGLDPMLKLAQSRDDWKASIEILLQLRADIFEKSWLTFAREHSRDTSAVIEEVVDTTQKE